MIYDNALDDDPLIIDNSPCIHEDKNDELAGCDDALIHESPILFLKSPIYTTEQKYAYVEKYLCGLQLSYEKTYCIHDTIIRNGTSNYFERGKHVNKCHIKFNDPFYLPKISKLHLPTIDIHWYTLIGCDSFMYKIPMHRKIVRLRCYLLHTLWCALLCFKVLGVFLGMITP
jgi:hypothetical protein